MLWNVLMWLSSLIQATKPCKIRTVTHYNRNTRTLTKHSLNADSSVQCCWDITYLIYLTTFSNSVSTCVQLHSTGNKTFPGYRKRKQILLCLIPISLLSYWWAGEIKHTFPSHLLVDHCLLALFQHPLVIAPSLTQFLQCHVSQFHQHRLNCSSANWGHSLQTQRHTSATLQHSHVSPVIPTACLIFMTLSSDNNGDYSISNSTAEFYLPVLLQRFVLKWKHVDPLACRTFITKRYTCKI
jgi:hypothetical protein